MNIADKTQVKTDDNHLVSTNRIQQNKFVSQINLLTFGGILLVLMITLFSCEKEDEISGNNDPNKKNYSINNWIYYNLKDYYLWESQMPEYKSQTTNPKVYFKTLIYKEDRWSYIVDNYDELIKSFKGIEVSAGYSIKLYYKDSLSNAVVAVVKFVYNNTPAQEKGIKRGDIILGMNGTYFDDENYEMIWETTDQELIMADLVEKGDTKDIVERKERITVQASELAEHPIILSKVLEFNNKKIGYMMYDQFIHNLQYYSDLDTTFAGFKNQNIEDLILDLRYNPGGTLSSADYLASSIAPSENINNKDLLVKFIWNDGLQDYFTSNNIKDQLYVYFTDTVLSNLNLHRLYVLTTRGTASASELIISSLKPYMNIITIGDTTHGKYTASITIPDDDKKWAMQPIVLKYANSLGLTEFKDGFAPDIIAKDNLFAPLGDFSKDPMLKAAVENITGETIPESKSVKIHSEPELRELNATDTRKSLLQKTGVILDYKRTIKIP